MTETKELEATAAIFALMLGRPIDWDTAPDDLLQSADWLTCQTYARAALTTASAEAEGLKARIVELEGALGQIAGTDLFEVTGYHTRTWSIPETGNEYESKDPIFKRSSFQNAQDFQAIARQALAGGTDHG